MRFCLTTPQLRELYVSGTDSYICGGDAVAAFFEIMAVLDAATSEHDLRALASLQFTPHPGYREELFLLQVRGPWHLLVRRCKDHKGPYLEIIDLSNLS